MNNPTSNGVPLNFVQYPMYNYNPTSLGVQGAATQQPLLYQPPQPMLPLYQQQFYPYIQQPNLNYQLQFPQQQFFAYFPTMPRAIRPRPPRYRPQKPDVNNIRFHNEALDLSVRKNDNPSELNQVQSPRKRKRDPPSSLPVQGPWFPVPFNADNDPGVQLPASIASNITNPEMKKRCCRALKRQNKMTSPDSTTITGSPAPVTSQMNSPPTGNITNFQPISQMMPVGPQSTIVKSNGCFMPPVSAISPFKDGKMKRKYRKRRKNTTMSMIPNSPPLADGNTCMPIKTKKWTPPIAESTPINTDKPRSKLSDMPVNFSNIEFVPMHHQKVCEPHKIMDTHLRLDFNQNMLERPKVFKPLVDYSIGVSDSDNSMIKGQDSPPPEGDLVIDLDPRAPALNVSHQSAMPRQESQSMDDIFDSVFDDFQKKYFESDSEGETPPKKLKTFYENSMSVSDIFKDYPETPKVRQSKVKSGALRLAPPLSQPMLYDGCPSPMFSPVRSKCCFSDTDDFSKCNANESGKSDGATEIKEPEKSNEPASVEKHVSQAIMESIKAMDSVKEKIYTHVKKKRCLEYKPQELRTTTDVREEKDRKNDDENDFKEKETNHDDERAFEMNEIKEKDINHDEGEALKMNEVADNDDVKVFKEAKISEDHSYCCIVTEKSEDHSYCCVDRTGSSLLDVKDEKDCIRINNDERSFELGSFGACANEEIYNYYSAKKSEDCKAIEACVGLKDAPKDAAAEDSKTIEAGSAIQNKDCFGLKDASKDAAADVGNTGLAAEDSSVMVVEESFDSVSDDLALKMSDDGLPHIETLLLNRKRTSIQPSLDVIYEGDGDDQGRLENSDAHKENENVVCKNEVQGCSENTDDSKNDVSQNEHEGPLKSSDDMRNFNEDEKYVKGCFIPARDLSNCDKSHYMDSDVSGQFNGCTEFAEHQKIEHYLICLETSLSSENDNIGTGSYKPEVESKNIHKPEAENENMDTGSKKPEVGSKHIHKPEAESENMDTGSNKQEIVKDDDGKQNCEFSDSSSVPSSYNIFKSILTIDDKKMADVKDIYEFDDDDEVKMDEIVSDKPDVGHANVKKRVNKQRKILYNYGDFDELVNDVIKGVSFINSKNENKKPEMSVTKFPSLADSSDDVIGALVDMTNRRFEFNFSKCNDSSQLEDFSFLKKEPKEEASVSYKTGDMPYQDHNSSSSTLPYDLSESLDCNIDDRNQSADDVNIVKKDEFLSTDHTYADKSMYQSIGVLLNEDSMKGEQFCDKENADPLAEELPQYDEFCGGILSDSVQNDVLKHCENPIDTQSSEPNADLKLELEKIDIKSVSECPICELKIVSIGLLIHMQIKHLYEKNFTCPDKKCAGLNFANIDLFRLHCHVTHPEFDIDRLIEKMIQNCPLCNDITDASNLDLLWHIKKYHECEGHVMVCPGCLFCGKNAQELFEHLTMFHNSGKPPSACPFCGVDICLNNCNLISHMWVQHRQNADTLPCIIEECREVPKGVLMFFKHLQSKHVSVFNQCFLIGKIAKKVLKQQKNYEVSKAEQSASVLDTRVAPKIVIKVNPSSPKFSCEMKEEERPRST